MDIIISFELLAIDLIWAYGHTSDCFIFHLATFVTTAKLKHRRFIFRIDKEPFCYNELARFSPTDSATLATRVVSLAT